MKRKAFTLIEMIATLAVIMILVTVSSIAVGKTLKTNREKSLQMKVANVLRGTEDYILEKNIKLIPGKPLYFSVSAMESAGIMEDNVTSAIAQVKHENGPFYVAVLKEVGTGKVTYTILNKTDFTSKVSVEGNDFNLVGAENSTIVGTEKEPINVAFMLQKAVGSPLYNLDIRKLTYSLEKVNGDGTHSSFINDKSVKNLTVDADGIYKFKLIEGLAPGEYELNLSMSSDALTSVVTTLSPISVVISKVHESPLICEVDTLPLTWYNTDVNLGVTCKQQDSNAKATSITYTGYKYPNTSETNGVTVSGTKTGAEIAADGKTTLAFSPEGVYKLEINAVLGAIKSNTVSQTVQIDKTAPNILGTIVFTGTLGNNSWYKSNVNVTSTAGSDQLSGFSYNSLSHTLFNTDTTGTTVTLRTYDVAGNASTLVSRSIKVDKVAPSCSSAGGNASWTNGNRTISGSCSDATSGCTGNISQLYNSEINTTTAGPGNVSDNAGNVTSCPANQTVKIDRTAPSCTSSGGSASWTNGNRTLIGACSDSLSGCTGNSSQTFTTDINTATGPGNVSDNAGNVGSCPNDQIVKIDKTAPSCTSSGGSASWTNGNITLTGTCSDGLSGCTGNSSQTFTSDINTTTGPGNVVDNAGNVGSCPANQTVKIDKTAPNVDNINNSSGSAWTNQNVTVTWNLSDAGVGFGTNAMQFTYDQGATVLSSMTQPPSNNLSSWSGSNTWIAERNNTLHFRAVDMLGNTSGWVSAGSLKIDKTDPTATWTKCSNHATGESDPPVDAIGWGRANLSDNLSGTIAADIAYKYYGSSYSYPTLAYTYIYSGVNNGSRSTIPFSAPHVYMKFQGLATGTLDERYKVNMAIKVRDGAGNQTGWIYNDPTGDGYYDWKPATADHGVGC